MFSILGGLLENGCVQRREMLKIGALGFGGITLPNILRADHYAGASSRKSVIQIHLDGGPPPMDMIDLKPQAPVEVRGELSGIRTKIPGFHICELMPKLASHANEFTFIRSLVGAEGRHDAFQCQSGFDAKDLQSIGGRPALGSVLTKLLPSSNSAPTFVDLMQGRPLVRNSARPGFLGPAFGPFRPDISKQFPRPLEDGMVKELSALGSDHTTSLTLHTSLQSDRLQIRSDLLSQLDRLRRQLDKSGMMDAMDKFQQQAAGILTSGRLSAALDLSREDPKTVAKYTPNPPTARRGVTDEGHNAMKKLLLARRLIEAGARCVSVSFGDFDTHRSNFPRMKYLLPILDHGLTALVTDLRERGMLDDVTIVAWGEFGRSPKVNADCGRDHWPRVAMAIMAGGGVPTGRVIGTTDRWAGEVVAEPIHYQDVLATIYKNLGIDALSTTILDPSGRPQYLLDRGRPIFG